LKSMVDHLRAGGNLWSAIDYFTLWAVRLSGVFPELRVNDGIAELVEEMFTKPLSGFDTQEWGKSTMPGLRRTLMRAIEQHVERKLLTVPLLEAI